jgi:hypothetical protein
MADNLVLNAGSGGATLATDEITGPRHVQFVKLMDGTLDSAAIIAGDATNGLDVDVTRLPADLALTDTITALDDAVTLNIANGETAVGVQITGTWTATLTFEATLDDTNWFTIGAHDGSGRVTTTTGNGNFLLGVGGYSQVRVRGSAFSTGTAVVTIIASRGAHTVCLVLPLPTGTNSIGQVTANAGTNLNTSALALETGGNLAAILTALGGTLTVDGSGVTQPVSAASLPLPTGAATAAKQPALGTAGTPSADVISVQGITSMTALVVDGSGVTQPVSAASLPLPSGAATAAKQPALGTAGTPSADIISVQGAASMTPLLVDGSGATQPVSGTVTANAGTNLNTSALALETGGNLATIAGWDNAVGDGASISGDVAHDAADAGEPVKIGGKASTNEPTAVAVDDRVNAWFDTFGRLVTVNGHANPETPVYVNATASGDTAVIGAPGVGVSLHIKKVSIHNGGGAVIAVTLQENASATNRWGADLAADGGGSIIDFGDRGWKLTANTGLDVNLGATGDVHVNVTDYYIAP